MAGAICTTCGASTNDATMPACQREDCPTRPVGYKPMSPEGAERAKAMLRERIAEKDAERGRPLTDSEKLKNLERAICKDDAAPPPSPEPLVDEPHRTEEQSINFREQARKAKALVDSWPEWKREAIRREIERSNARARGERS